MGYKVQPLWRGETAVCLASGPSLTAADVDAVRGRARVVAVNNCYQLAPWADVLYAADSKWWRWHEKGTRSFPGMKFSLQRSAASFGVTILTIKEKRGLSLDPGKLCTGENSGYQAINLAVLFGATRIVLLGYDMQLGPKGEHHWHKEHPQRTPNYYKRFASNFRTLVEPLAAAGVEVINCSRRSALDCFPRRPLEDIFPPVAVIDEMHAHQSREVFERLEAAS